MKFPLDLLPMALCGLATIVAVAVVLVASDLLRRFVLDVIARVEGVRRAPPVVDEAKLDRGSAPPAKSVSPSETIPG